MVCCHCCTALLWILLSLLATDGISYCIFESTGKIYTVVCLFYCSYVWIMYCMRPLEASFGPLTNQDKMPQLAPLVGCPTNKYKEKKLRILSLIRAVQLGIIEIKKETREVAYTFRYTSGHLIPNSVMGYRLN